MTREELNKLSLNELLTKMGWSKAFFAKRILVHPRTVRRWAITQPRIAILYLRLIIRESGGCDD